MITVEKYFADWCAPCKQLTPIMEEVKNHYGDKINLVHVDIENESNKDRVIENNIRSVPTVIIYDGDEEYVRINGLNPKKEYISVIDNLI